MLRDVQAEEAEGSAARAWRFVGEVFHGSLVEGVEGSTEWPCDSGVSTGRLVECGEERLGDLLCDLEDREGDGEREGAEFHVVWLSELMVVESGGWRSSPFYG